MSSIYTLTGDALEIESMIDDFQSQAAVGSAEYEADREAMEAAIIDLMIANEEAMRSKVDGIYKLKVNMTHNIEGLKKEANNLREKASLRESTIKRVTEALKSAMEAMNVTELKGDLFTAKLVGNGGLMPMTVDPIYVNDPKLLPIDFKKITIEPNNAEIRSDIEKQYDEYREMVVAEHPAPLNMKADQKKAYEQFITEETLSRVNARAKYAQLAPRGKHVGIK